MIGGDGSLPVMPRIDGMEDNDVATAEKEDNFLIVDDEEGPPFVGREVQQQQDPRDSSIFEEEKSGTLGVDEEEDVPESSILAAYQTHINSLNDKGLNLSLFSCWEKVELDLLLTQSTIGAPMKAHEAIMQWTIRSICSGYVFRDSTITSRKTVLSRVTKCLNRDELKPIWDTLHLPYTNVTIKVAYFQASAIFVNLLCCGHLNVDANYIFNGNWNPDHDPYAVPSGNVIGDLNTGRSNLKTYARAKNNLKLLVFYLRHQVRTSRNATPSSISHARKDSLDSRSARLLQINLEGIR
jgi:hypothetical protein